LNLPCAFCTTPLAWIGIWANTPPQLLVRAARRRGCSQKNPRVERGFFLFGGKVAARLRQGCDNRTLLPGSCPPQVLRLSAGFGRTSSCGGKIRAISGIRPAAGCAARRRRGKACPHRPLPARRANHIHRARPRSPCPRHAPPARHICGHRPSDSAQNP